MTEQAKTFQQVISGFSLKEIPFYLQWSGPAFTDVPADGSPDEEQIYQDTEDRLLARFGMSRKDAQHIDYSW